MIGDLGDRTYNNIKDNDFYNGFKNNTLIGKVADNVLKNSANISEFGRNNADFWQEQSDKIQIDPRYQGLQGLKTKETFLPTLMGELGGQTTNIVMAGGGGAAGAKTAAQLGLKGLAKSALITAGTAIPNLAQEGQYLDKIEAFKQIYGRVPTADELAKIQNATLLEKGTNTALETFADRILFGRIFPKGTTSKGFKNVAKNAFEQGITEGITEGMQEGVSIAAEKALGINQGNNAERLLEASALGSLTGGVIGGGGSLISKNYNSQFKENPKQSKTINTVKNVSAKIINNGKELYNSTTKDSFDDLKTLSREGSFNNANENAPNVKSQVIKLPSTEISELQKIAPKTIEKQILNNNDDVIDLVPNSDNVWSEALQLIDNNNKVNESTALVPYNQNAELQKIAPKTYEKQQNNIDNYVEDYIDKSSTFSPDNWFEKRKEEPNNPELNSVSVDEMKELKKYVNNFKNTILELKIQDSPLPVIKGRYKNKFYTKISDELGYDLTLSDRNFNRIIQDIKNRASSTQTNFTEEEYSELEKRMEQSYINAEGMENDIEEKYSKFYKALSILDNYFDYNDIINNTQIKRIEKKEVKNGRIEKTDTNAISRKARTISRNKVDTGKTDKIKNNTRNDEKLTSDLGRSSVENGRVHKNLTSQNELQKLAPKTFEKQSQQHENNSGYHTKDFKKGDIVKDIYSDQIYEVIEPDKKGMGYLRNVDDDSISTPNAYNNARYTLYVYNENELIRQQEFKYNPKAQRMVNADNYVYSQSDVVEAYNNYVKNPTTENKEKFQDISGSKYSEYEKLEPMFKDIGNVLPPYKNSPKEDYNNVVDKQKNYGGELKGNVETNSDVGSELSKEQERAGLEEQRISQEQSSNAGHIDNVRREHDISDERGVTKKDLEIINKEYKNQHELNKAIEDYINNKEYRKYPGSVRMPQAVKDWLKKYTGAGGLEKQGAEGKGLLSEYYTPENVVKKMWDLTAQYINTNGAKVLEPSVGIGRFLEYAPDNVAIEAVEMNPVSASIAKILYPNANIQIGEFQERFINKKTNLPLKKVIPEYDIVIGNPPYGTYSGRYKGMGEGKTIARIETYFIRRGLDTLKENGIMTFIVPSSFLDGAITKTKQEIAVNAELVDAYRLPENVFETTSIGTDIIVLRKKKMSGNTSLFNAGNWFKQHPEKILGSVETRKNRFGREETFVKGNKNIVENIDTSKKDIKHTKNTDNVNVVNNENKIKNPRKILKNDNKNIKKSDVSGKIEYEEYLIKNSLSDKQLSLYKDTRVDGTLPKNKYQANDEVNQYDGELYNDFNYLQGDIYEKLDSLKYEHISDKQKEIQRKKLLSVLPEAKTIEQISFNPTSDFIRELVIGQKEVTEYDWQTRSDKTVKENITLDREYRNYVKELSNSERNGISVYDIEKYLQGAKISIEYNYSSYTLTEAEKKKERNMKKAEYMTKLKNVVDKTFNDFVRTELSDEYKNKLVDKWNRTFNAVYNPDYKEMPLLVRELNSEFYGKKLTLQDVQIEGVNFLTNKGVGLLGFEVGVGKTLTGIISTVQNMQMGRCKKPLILVPKQVKDNWIREINQAFPNIKVNDVDNMGRFKGNIEENTLTVATYEALGNIWYDKDTAKNLINSIYSVQNNFARKSTERGKEKAKERAEQLLGLAEGGNKKLFNIQDVGFDHITIDEAHNFKNLFADARADGQDGNPYVNISGGSTSTRAARLFLFTQFILDNNNNRNVFMLTATPFNNSPLEVFNMLSFIAKDKLDRMGLYNVYQFMENYADITSDWIVNSKNEVEYKQVVKGFKNAGSLRELIKSAMLIRSADDAGIVRPEKFTKRVILEPSQSQLDLILKAEEDAVKGDKNDGAVLKAINQSRKATLSPDIASDNFDVSPEDFIMNSPKLNYVVSAVESMKKSDPNTSQIIYMPLGVKFISKIKQYLVNKGVYKDNEIAIIDSSVADDKISSITDSFNDENGNIKLIIGTNKIKEGMNLNKNSSVLYTPYLDWNPTDFTQIVGRIWRRGNKYSKIRVVVPLLKNSSDSFMFQKINEKTDRINNIMDEGKEYIDTSELNTAEEKINMISNPDKKVKMFVNVEMQKLNAKIKDLQGRIETAIAYKNALNSYERTVKSTQDTVDYYTNLIKSIDPKAEKYRYESVKNDLNKVKKDLASQKAGLNTTKNKIKRLELDLDGKDSEDSLNAEIEKINKQIQELKVVEKNKLEEYKKEYELERSNKKSIDELIKEFEQDTKDLYGTNDMEEFDVPFISNFVEKFKNFTAVRENIKNGKTISELCETENIFKVLKDELSDIGDYIVTEMPDRMKRTNLNGSHLGGREKVILLNMEAIGNDVNKFARVILHEAQHAKQENEYRELLKKDKLTQEDIQKIRNFKKNKEVNKKKTEYYNKHKAVLAPILKHINLLSKEDRQAYVNNLRPLQKEIFNNYYKLYENYKNSENEVEARQVEQIAIERLNYARTNRQIFNSNRRPKEWNMGTGTRGSSRGDERGSLGRVRENEIEELETEEAAIERIEQNDGQQSTFGRPKKWEMGRRPSTSGIISGNGKNGENIRILGRNREDKVESEEDIKDYEASEEIELTPAQKAARTRANNIKQAKNLDNAKAADDKVKRYVREWYADIEKNRYDVNRTLNSFQRYTKNIADEFSKKTGLKVTDKMVREIMPFLRERTDFPEKLDRPDLKKLYDKLSSQDKKRLTKLADTLSHKFKVYYDNYNEIKGVVPEHEIENHISHIWDLDKKSNRLLTNYFSINSRFAKQRTIDTLYEGINGIKIDGEIHYFKPKTLDYAEILKSQSDSLIKASADMILADNVKSLKVGKIPLILPIGKAPQHWVEVNHPALNKSVYSKTEEDMQLLIKTPVKVHPDIAKTLNTVFETPASKNNALNTLDNINSVFKQSQLGFSGFHMVALSESALGNIGIKGTVNLLNPKRIFDEVVKGNWGIYKDDTIAKQAIDDGLQIGSTLDLDKSNIEKIIDDTTNYLEKLPVLGKVLAPIGTAFAKAQKINSSILWDYLHNNYKLETYKLLCEQEAQKQNRPLSKVQREEIAQWVNDSYGGQVWELLGITPSQRRLEQRVLLSPDWLRSTTRQFLGMLYNKQIDSYISSKAKESDFWNTAKELGKEWGISSLTDDVNASELRAKIARAFWLRSVITFAIMYNLLNAAMREWDREKYPELYPKNMSIKDYSIFKNAPGHEFNVFIGRNSDGTERYIRIGKQFKEVPELVENPIKKLGSKISPIGQLTSQIVTGHTASGFKNKDFFEKDGNTQKQGWDRVKAAGLTTAKSFMPFSANDIFNPDKDFSAWSLFMPTSKGMTKYKTIKEFSKAYDKGANKDDMKRIAQAAYRNNFTPKDIASYMKQGKTAHLKPYKQELKKAFINEDKNQVKKALAKMDSKGISETDKKKIYEQVLKDYLKQKRSLNKG